MYDCADCGRAESTASHYCADCGGFERECAEYDAFQSASKDDDWGSCAADLEVEALWAWGK
jgi:hypothetical protein